MRRDPKQDIGKRAIHPNEKIAGTIIESKADSEHDYDDTIQLDNGFGGHRHYFWIEGDPVYKCGDEFEKHKDEYFK